MPHACGLKFARLQKGKVSAWCDTLYYRAYCEKCGAFGEEELEPNRAILDYFDDAMVVINSMDTDGFVVESSNPLLRC